MTADELTVAGRRFRTRADYEAALRDQKKIERIKAETDLDNPKQIYELLKDLQSGSYRFETIVGRDFDDEIYEKAEALKKQGITPENAAKTVKADKKKKEKRSKKKEYSVNLSDYDKDMQKQILIEMKKREKRRKLIVALSSLVAVLCFGYFGVYYFFAARTSMDYEQLSDLKGSDALSETQEKNDFSLHKSSVKLPDILDEYKTLYSKNKRLIGWLKIDDTNIDYPVMQTSDNVYYLDHNLNQEYDKNGSIFMDRDCDVLKPSTNYIIYGHHMKNGSMFGKLDLYEDENYCKEHPYIRFDTIYEKGTYEVMYVFRSRVYSEEEIVFKYYQFIDANSEQEFNSYMSEMAEMSLYDTGVTAEYGDQLLTLSTCDYQEKNGRFVVVARKIKE